MQKRKLLPPKRLSESWKLAVLGSLAESMAYLTEAHIADRGEGKRQPEGWKNIFPPRLRHGRNW